MAVEFLVEAYNTQLDISLCILPREMGQRLDEKQNLRYYLKKLDSLSLVAVVLNLKNDSYLSLSLAAVIKSSRIQNTRTTATQQHTYKK